ncbi:TetR/AcrR family transcriptional regulator [Loktanella sp. S4079]|uniref:TetR/AcrR family transcriptional regulator n=1 Tax=Loktanella sp. S4079 TaxID=579483 RepID=UPI0005FA316D|nr:TetR/AcrR family transcriptional regulator [Loktanella sp. S4079]KJZ18611.1 TetR family transcriptional regulator [Loktanella sp. S4079]
MSQDSQAERGWRGSPELWINAAYDALIDKGVDGVKILPLAETLGLSRTSFYWFFENRKQLLAALIERWEARTTEALIRATSDYAATETEAMLNVISTFLSEDVFDTRLELAVRAWAQQDADVLRRLQEADQCRLDSLREMLMRWGHSDEDADVRARTIYLVQVGYISMRVHEPIAERLARFPNYVEIYTGQRPPQHEMDRFMARIGYKDGQS